MAGRGSIYDNEESPRYKDQDDVNRVEGKDEYLLARPSQQWNIRRKGKMRDAECARLKAIGWPLDKIARYMCLDEPDPENGPVRVAAAIKRALGEMARFANDEARLMESNSLDELEWEAWKTLQERHVVISQGRVVRDDETGEVIPDDRYILETVDRILKIKERRAKLLGLDAPMRREVITMDSIDQEIAKLETELKATKQQS
jgi:hypothetical protein